MSEVENKISPYLSITQDVIGQNINNEKINSILDKVLKKIKNEPEFFDKEFLEILGDFELFKKFYNYIEIYKISRMDDEDKIIKYLNFRFKFNQASKKRKEFDHPPYLLIEPVSACNLKCPMCFQIDKTFTRKPFMGIMKWELFQKVVDEANEIGVGAITLASRGEPLMHPKISEMIEYVSNKKNIFELKLNSNASFLTEKICHDIFKNNVTTFVISADHYEKEKFEQLRKGSNFEKISKNVEMLFSIRKKFYKNSETEIRVSGIDYFKNLDRNKFKKYWEKISDNVSASYAVERWDTYNNSKDMDNLNPCSYLWDRMYVWFDGKCNPCDADYKSYLSYGDVSNSSIKEVWNGKKLKKHREIHTAKKRFDLIPCDRCGIEFN